MDSRPHSNDPTASEWGAYGARDAIVFAVGFILALMLAAPFG